MMQLEVKAHEFKAQSNAQPDEKELIKAGTVKLYSSKHVHRIARIKKLQRCLESSVEAESELIIRANSR